MNVGELKMALSVYPDTAKVVMFDFRSNGNIDRVEPWDDTKVILIGKDGVFTYGRGYKNLGVEKNSAD